MAAGYWKLQDVTRGNKGLPEVTGSYRRVKWVTRG